MSVTWRETASRRLAQVVMEDFPSTADALAEIIDNPIDYRRGRQIEMNIVAGKDADEVRFDEWGGEGMDDAGIADLLNWGSGHVHSDEDIGRYHKGGKSAFGYIGDSLEILARRAGRPEVWSFVDPAWKTREEWADYGEPEPYTGRVAEPFASLPPHIGFTRIRLTKLVKDRRYNLETLRWRIANTYRKLLADGALTITLNGELVKALELPLSSAFESRAIDISLPSGQRIRGWVGRLDRDATKPGRNRIPGGIRCLYQGRLICEGEFFGHHAEGKGLLASLIGEIELGFAAPLSNKTNFKRDAGGWPEIEAAMHEHLTPIIAEFRRAAESHPVSMEERKRVAAVRHQLQEVLQALNEHDEGDAGSRGQGRRRPTPRVTPAPPPTDRHPGDRRPAEPRTPPPPGAVGTLRRLRHRVAPSGEVPPIILADLDPAVRSESDQINGRVTRILINRAYPIYSGLDGDEAYIAETALMELLRPQAGETISIERFLAEINDCLAYWYRTFAEAA